MVAFKVCWLRYPLFAFELGTLAVASIIFHQNLFWVTPSSCSRLSTHHLTSDVRHGLEPVAPVQVYGLKPSMLFGNLGLLLNLPSFEYSEASHFLQCLRSSSLSEVLGLRSSTYFSADKGYGLFGIRLPHLLQTNHPQPQG